MGLEEKFKKLECEYKMRLHSDKSAIIRYDGRAFRTFTKSFEKPFSQQIKNCMLAAASTLLSEVDGAVLAYTQSDEISLLLKKSSSSSQIWFDGKIQKIVSVGACMAANSFNKLLPHGANFAEFDGRVLSLEEEQDANDYLKWRTADAIKNSISMLAYHNFSHKELHGKNSECKKDMLVKVGSPWEFLPEHFKFGSFLYKTNYTVPEFHFVDKLGEQKTVFNVERTRIDTIPATPDSFAKIAEFL